MEDMELGTPDCDLNSKNKFLDDQSKKSNEETEREQKSDEDSSDNEKVGGDDDDDDDDDEDEDDDDGADELEVRVLESLLLQNPYDYSSYVALISKLQKMGELEKLRDARKRMSNKFPLSPDLWLAWLRDEMKLAVSPEERTAVMELCEKAIGDYLSVEIWLEYVQFSIGLMANSDNATNTIRNLFERALTSVGLHVTKGAIIWEAFREFENILVSMASDDNERQIQIDRVGNLFRRQLACPLLDMEKTLEEYSKWKLEDGKSSSINDDIINVGYNRALIELNSRLPFEEKLCSHGDELELLDAYKGYLLFEKQNGDPSRTTLLFERAITDLSLHPILWEDYLSYVESTIKSELVLTPIYKRATQNVTWHSIIWQKWMRSMEKWNKPLLEVQSLLESALAANFASAIDYRNIWITFIEYLRRRIDSVDDEQQKNALEIIRATFNRACEHMAKLFGLEGDPQCVILQYWARTEAIHGHDMEKARTLWSDILSQGHSTAASSWLEYISLEKCYGDTKHLRKLFQRALVAVKDWPESIANSWIDFERDEGTLEQMEQCEIKTKQRLEKVNEERENAQRKRVQHQSQEINTHGQPVSKNNTGKRKNDDCGKWENLSTVPSKQRKIENSNKSYKEGTLNNEKKETEKKKIAPPPGYVAPVDDKMETDQDVIEQITVFISNLDYTATDEEVRAALAPAGPITLFKMVKDYKGRSKGFCYVQLESPSAVETALKLDRVPINGRPMYVSRCDPNRTTRGSAFKYPNALEKSKLFIKGLAVTTTKEDLENIFKVHGALKDVRIVTYRNGHSKGLAYVEFEDKLSASKALLATDGITLMGNVISVAISKPPERKKNSDESTHVKSLGGTNVSRTQMGVPKTMLSMIPRSVKKSTIGNGNINTDNNVKSMNNEDFRNMLLNKH
ncbi:hypothetical protein PV327_006548 [Microctonus hyperodae]|uniref:RRM domain-containing protein n=1 Tax=Microctonus hyperodae TaxID=165561 RepID=A0AA39F4H9_MICHY|nr:hypothetical protein PV327_006548 [Microctonus hyperodae]